MFLKGDNITYFDSFSIEHIPKEAKKFIPNKNITTNIYRTEAKDSVICGYFCIGFIDFMLKGKKVCLILPIDFQLTNIKKMIK